MPYVRLPSGGKITAHYKELVPGARETPVGRFGKQIVPYDITSLHPLALMISTPGAPNSEKKEMFGDLVSFLVRRAVCGLTSKNYNNVLITTLRQLHGAEINPLALRSLLTAGTGEASRWLEDAEFSSACLTAPLCCGRVETPRIRAMLTELEAFLRKTVKTEETELPDLSNLGFDHLVPRSWMTY